MVRAAPGVVTAAVGGGVVVLTMDGGVSTDAGWDDEPGVLAGEATAQPVRLAKTSAARTIRGVESDMAKT